MKRYLLLTLLLATFTLSAQRRVYSIEGASNYLQEGEWELALEQCRALLLEDSNSAIRYALTLVAEANSDAHLNLAHTVKRSQQHGVAIVPLFAQVDSIARSLKDRTTYERMLLTVKAEMPWFRYLCNRHLLALYLFRKEYPQALALSEELLLHAPQSLEALHGKALALAQLGEPIEANNYYKKILEIDPNNLDALIQIGSYYYVRGELKLKRVENRYNQLISPNSHQYNNFVAEKREIIHDEMAEALLYLQQAESLVSTPYLRQSIAQIELLMKDTPERKSKRTKPSR